MSYCYHVLLEEGKVSYTMSYINVLLNCYKLKEVTYHIMEYYFDIVVTNFIQYIEDNVMFPQTNST